MNQVDWEALPGGRFTVYGHDFKFVAFTGVSHGLAPAKHVDAVHSGRARLFIGPAGTFTATLEGLDVADGDRVSMIVLLHPKVGNSPCIYAYNHTKGTTFEDPDAAIDDLRHDAQPGWTKPALGKGIGVFLITLVLLLLLGRTLSSSANLSILALGLSATAGIFTVKLFTSPSYLTKRLADRTRDLAATIKHR
jgi:hypothetical protein